MATDGPAVTALVAACPPLDGNSAYCNLLQCTHFADTCLVAERDHQIAGWISGYRLPADPQCFFLWQLAVAPDARGQGLSQTMFDHLLGRPALRDITRLRTTITADNKASWASFERLAKRWQAGFQSSELFHRDRHFAGLHPTEWQIEIGPFGSGQRAGLSASAQVKARQEVS